MKKSMLFISLLLTLVGFGQEHAEKEINLQISKVSYLDSLKATFINHSTSTCIDERWIAELANIELSENMFSDISKINIDEEVAYSLSSEVVKKRLAKLDARSPFHIEYNPALENTIKAFLKNRKPAFERLMAISEYYFPMFEEHLAKYNIPMELKYLAIVESALNPTAKSRVGASGLWQFMYPTGKQYNLEVNSYVDERYDPLKATEAACQYLSNLYGIFGDWSLVLASYNAGPGNVSKAIRRSGGSQNYWNIRKNLPRETANYVPAFLATMYIYEYRKEHGLQPKKAAITYFETDTIQIKKQVSFKQISELLDIPVHQLEFLNPIYKLKVIPYEQDKAHFLRLPKNKIGLFVSNEAKIYAYIDYLEALTEKIKLEVRPMVKDSLVSVPQDIVTAPLNLEENVIFYKVQRGDHLKKIADKYGVTVSELKQWNTLQSTTLFAGSRIKIYAKKKETVVAPPVPAVEEWYTVQKGDTLYLISKKYPGVTVEDLKKRNTLCDESIQPGMKLKING